MSTCYGASLARAAGDVPSDLFPDPDARTVDPATERRDYVRSYQRESLEHEDAAVRAWLSGNHMRAALLSARADRAWAAAERVAAEVCS